MAEDSGATNGAGAGQGAGAGAGENAGAGANGAGNGAAGADQGRGDAQQRHAEFQDRRNEAERTAQAEPQLRQQKQSAEPKPGERKQAGDGGERLVDLGDGVEASAADLRALMADKAARDSARLSRPQREADYVASLPSDFKSPDGTKFELNQNDPLLAQAKAVAFKEGLSQEGFSQLLALYASTRIFDAQTITTARNSEVAKLGATGPSRVNAITTFLRAQLGEAGGNQLASRIFTASDVELFERLMAKVQGQSGSTFSQRGREAPPQPGRLSDEAHSRLTPAQKLDYARNWDQRSMPEWKSPSER